MVVLRSKLEMWIYYALISIILPAWVNSEIQDEKVLRNHSKTFDWWSNSPVESTLKVYIYSVTNSKEYLKNGSKLIVHEVGPYVYREKVQKTNFKFNRDGTILSYDQEKTYFFDQNLSVGSEDDNIVVPNIPLLMILSHPKYISSYLRIPLSQVIKTSKFDPFINVTVRNFLWGYEDLILIFFREIASDVNFPSFDKFGLFNKKNSSIERVNIYIDSTNIGQLKDVGKLDGKSDMKQNKTEKSSVDGAILSPNITKSTSLYIYDNYFCEPIPLIYSKEFVTSDNIKGFRFSPSKDLFSKVDRTPKMACLCPEGSSFSPPGFLNASSCQYNTPVLVSFPHFYLAEDKFRAAVEGVSPPDPEKHMLYLDVNPEMGAPLQAVKRIQYNFAAPNIPPLPGVKAIPDIIFPVMWFEEIVDFQHQH